MKPIHRVTYYGHDENDDLRVDARVEFEDGEVRVFYEEDDLIAIQNQLQLQRRQSEMQD